MCTPDDEQLYSEKLNGGGALCCCVGEKGIQYMYQGRVCPFVAAKQSMLPVTCNIDTQVTVI